MKIKGIVVLMFVMALTVMPFVVNAEMQAMTDNEMEMVTGQATILQLADKTITCLLTKTGMAGSVGSMMQTMSPYLQPILQSKLMVWMSNKVMIPLMNTEIPYTDWLLK